MSNRGRRAPTEIRPKPKKSVAADVRDDKDYIRGTFQFSREVGTKLDRLAEQFDGNRTEAIRYALTIADTILDARAAGQQIVVLNPDQSIEGQIAGPKEVIVPLVIGRQVESVVKQEATFNATSGPKPVES